MIALLLGIFFIGYTAITLEHSIRIDKLIPALLMMVLSWTVIALGIEHLTVWMDPHTSKILSLQTLDASTKTNLVESTLLHHFGKTSEILIFLMGAMAIVEMIDHFDGFGSMKSLIKAKRKLTLIWILSFIAFLLSAIIDNLTATIVLITITRKLIEDTKLRMWFAGFIIIAANAGGAWSPIGDVTTTMLWMAGKITTVKVMSLLIIPSLLAILLPLLSTFILPIFKGTIEHKTEENIEQSTYGKWMLLSGLILIIFVPIFKTITHLPPYLGMMLSLGCFAILSEIISKRQIRFTQPDEADEKENYKGPTLQALGKIEMPSVLFFLGILMTVSALEATGVILQFGETVRTAMSDTSFVTLLGASSAIIDNVPLVAASIGMFPNAADANVWHLIAFAAGTGGSMLIIGSAAGVVAMGMEKITFFWYLKNITLLAVIGYIGGIASFLLIV